MPRTTKPKRSWVGRRTRVLLIVVGVLLLIRIALPYVLLHLVNKRLANMPGYTGHVDDLDLALIRGAYRMQLFEIDKLDSLTNERTPFLAADDIDLSVEWKALFHGSVVGEMVVTKPEIRFTKDAVEPAAVQKDTTTFRDLLDDLMPLKINRVEMHEGVLRYRDPSTKPPVDINMSNMEVLALNLRNSYDSTALLPATLKIGATLYGGTFDMHMHLNPLAEQPTFDMDADLKDVSLPRINEFFKAYGNFDVNRGTFGLYTEFAARAGQVAGYVKPIIKELDVVGPEDRGDNVLQKMWESLVGAAGVAFRNLPQNQVATKVEIKGPMDGPRANILYAIVDLLRNAFIQALQPAVDHQISIRSVTTAPKKEGFFKRLFPGDKEGGDKGGKRSTEKNKKEK